MADLPFLHRHFPEVHGHRGCRGLRPENTLIGFLHALELGVDVLEMDVVVSADLQVVVSHEPWLNPSICTGPQGEQLSLHSASSYNLYQMTYSTIQQCDCGHPHPGFPNQIRAKAAKPLLQDVLLATEEYALNSFRVRPLGYSIEIKSAPEGDDVFHPAPAAFFTLVYDQLIQAGVAMRSTLLSFDVRILRQARLLQPALRTCMLVDAHQPWLPSLQELGFLPNTIGPAHSSVTPFAVSEIRRLFPSLRLVPWTANTHSDFTRLISLGVDGITTDYPDQLLTLRPAHS